MSESSTTIVAPSNTEASSKKALRLKMGRLIAPISAVSVLSKTQEHSFGGKKAISWAIITPDQKLVKATTYGGDLGKDFNLGAHNTVALPADGSKERRHALKGYTDVTDPSQFPAFVVAASSLEKDDEATEENTAPTGQDTGEDQQD